LFKQTIGIENFGSTSLLDIPEDPNHYYCGVGQMVSFILVEKTAHPYAVTWEAVNIIKKNLGQSFCRKTVGHVGLNKYIGQRKGSQACHTPVSGPGSGKEHHYKLGHCWEDQIHTPLVSCILNSLANQISSFGLKSDPLIHSLLPGGTKGTLFKPCTTGIVTINFANVKHTDSGDKRTKKIMDEAILVSKCGLNHKYPEEKKKSLYLNAFMKTFGLGLPTSCAYQFVGREPEVDGGVEVVQYFLYDGLSVAIRLQNYAAQMFYGHAVAHRTAQAIILVNGKVYLPMEETGMQIFAWGGT
jgi:hypothetical protein